jgi:hypothetical protein
MMEEVGGFRIERVPRYRGTVHGRPLLTLHLVVINSRLQSNASS